MITDVDSKKIVMRLPNSNRFQMQQAYPLSGEYFTMILRAADWPVLRSTSKVFSATMISTRVINKIFRHTTYHFKTFEQWLTSWVLKDLLTRKKQKWFTLALRCSIPQVNTLSMSNFSLRCCLQASYTQLEWMLIPSKSVSLMNMLLHASVW